MAKQQIICGRLKELRTEYGISQKKLGILSGIDEFSSSARVNQYEKGKHVPDFATIQRFAKVLKVPACYFYAENDDIAYMIRVLGEMTPREITKVVTKIKKIL